MNFALRHFDLGKKGRLPQARIPQMSPASGSKIQAGTIEFAQRIRSAIRLRLEH